MACDPGTDPADLDADGLPDACELGLAQAFAPELVVDPAPCERTRADGLPTGGWLWGVRPQGDGARLAFLPAYEVDCEWEGPKCWVVFWVCEGHAGDSEAIALELERVDGGYRVAGVFLSAHCFNDAACRWYRGADLGWFAWRRGAPVIWVARGKHANYPSRDACDAGHHWLDTCDGNLARERFPVDARRNIGSAVFPFMGAGDCIVHPGDPAATRRECFWSERSFQGWREIPWGDRRLPT